jgi:outer membrane protein TolC
LEQIKLQLLSELNVMQGLDIRTVYQPADTQLLKFETPFDSLRTLTFHRNRNLKVLEKNIALRQLELKAQKASAFPQISLNVSYGLNRLTNEAGFLLFNNTASLLGGITASWMLYDAGNLRRQTQNQLLMQARAQTEFDRQRTELEARLQIGWAHYLRQKQQVQREEENRAFSIDAMEIAMERYRIGSSSTLELMLVQQEVTQAESRLAYAKHNCNQAVIQLLALDGSLMIPE